MPILQWVSNWVSSATSYVVEVSGYTTDFFLNIGKSVSAGLSGFFHVIVDFFIFLIFFAQYLGHLFSNLFSPVLYIFEYFSQIWTTLFGSVSSTSVITFNSQAITFLTSYPQFSILTSVVGGLLCLVVVIASVKILAS